MVRDPRTTYHQMDLYSMSPPKRVVMLYTYLLSYLRQARAFLEVGETEKKQNKLFKALDATEILLSALDEDKGGEIARHLASIYTYFLKRIIHIDLHSDLEALDQIITMVDRLHNTWVEAAQTVEPSRTAAAI